MNISRSTGIQHVCRVP